MSKQTEDTDIKIPYICALGDGRFGSRPALEAHMAEFHGDPPAKPPVTDQQALVELEKILLSFRKQSLGGGPDPQWNSVSNIHVKEAVMTAVAAIQPLLAHTTKVAEVEARIQEIAVLMAAGNLYESDRAYSDGRFVVVQEADIDDRLATLQSQKAELTKEGE